MPEFVCFFFFFFWNLKRSFFGWPPTGNGTKQIQKRPLEYEILEYRHVAKGN